jgi:hypothetical protein
LKEAKEQEKILNPFIFRILNKKAAPNVRGSLLTPFMKTYFLNLAFFKAG